MPTLKLRRLRKARRNYFSRKLKVADSRKLKVAERMLLKATEHMVLKKQGRDRAPVYSPFDSEKLKTKKNLWFETYRRTMIYLSPMLAMNAGIHVKSTKTLKINIIGPTLKALDRLAVEITNTIESRRV